MKGGGAIESYRQSQRPPQRADPSEFVRVEATAEPDETIDGLDCAKIRLRRWFYGDDPPFIEIVWLAKERNYLCARAEYPAEDTGVLRHEGRVTQWREVQPGLWLPTRVSVVQREPRWEKELAVDEASFDVDCPLSRIRDVELPDNLPVYRFDAEGYLEGSAATTKCEPRPRAELDRVIEELRREAARYGRYDATVKAVYRNVNADSIAGRATVLQNVLERSVADNGRLYSQAKKWSWTADGGKLQSVETEGYDRVWNRAYGEYANVWPASAKGLAAGGRDERIQHKSGASLSRGGPDAIATFRPHTAVFGDSVKQRSWWPRLLATSGRDEDGSNRYDIAYLGAESRDGHDCEKLCIRLIRGQKPPANEYFLWLAKDRNFLPIRAEWYDWHRDTKLPQSIALVDDLREVAPGLWFPFHAVHRNFIMDVDGRIFIAWSYESYVTNLGLAPAAPESLFQVNVPAGTPVNVFSEQGRRIGQFRQDVGGPSFISDEQWQTMLTAERSKGNTAELKQ